MPLALLAVPGPTTPGNRKANASGERKAPTPPSDNGSSSTWRDVITPLTSEVCVLSVGAAPETVTVVEALLTARVKFKDVVLSIWTTTSVFTWVSNPGADADTL